MTLRQRHRTSILPIQLACLDMAGTTVADDGLVEQAFEVTLDEMAVSGNDPDRLRMTTYVRDTMGTSKIEVFRSLFGDEARAQAANTAFERAFANLVGTGVVRPLPGAAGTIDLLRSRGVRVALTTGFSAPTRTLVLESLGWEHIADLVLSPSDAGRGRPYPDMILTAVVQLRIDSVQAVAVAGDTEADMVSGVRSGASMVAGVLTGSDDRARLLAAGATSVMASVAELPPLLGIG
jgi:phosphoglycolate phosphatase